MYFQSRVEAGRKLADLIVQKYQGSDSVVVAMSDGGAMVGMQIALRLECPLTMLLSEPIRLPREETALAGISQDGSVTYNSALSSGQISEFLGEYRGLIEQEKLTKIRAMNRQTGTMGLIRKDLLRGRNIILVSDALTSSFSLDVAMTYLKPIMSKKVMVATPLATVPAVDRMHVLVDEIFCLSVVQDFINTDHYYDTQDVPDHALIVKTIEHILKNWQ